MDTWKWVGGTLAAASMTNMLVHYDDEPHPHQEGPQDPPTELTRSQYETSSSASAAMPPGRQIFAHQHRDDYYTAHQVAQMSAQMTTRRNTALFAGADRGSPPALLTGPIGTR